MKVGDKIYIVELNRKNSGVPIEVTVTKIGKKYFETSNSLYGRFYIEDLKHDAGQYSARYEAYLNIKEYEDKKELGNLYAKIRTAFGGYGSHGFTLDTLRMISNILDESK